MIAALALSTNKPLIAWASAEGSYIYHQFLLNGPAYLYPSTVGGAQGLSISTGSTAATPSNYTGAIPFTRLGAYTSSQLGGIPGLPGQEVYNTTIYSTCYGTATITLLGGATNYNGAWVYPSTSPTAALRACQ